MIKIIFGSHDNNDKIIQNLKERIVALENALTTALTKDKKSTRPIIKEREVKPVVDNYAMVELVCDCCGKKFTRTKREHDKNGERNLHNYCSKPCFYKGMTRKKDNDFVNVTCSFCNRQIKKSISAYNGAIRAGQKRFFCDMACNLAYRRTHKDWRAPNRLNRPSVFVDTKYNNVLSAR